MNSERATRAFDLPECCGINPQRVARNGDYYIECPRCRARTQLVAGALANEKWRRMHDAVVEADRRRVVGIRRQS